MKITTILKSLGFFILIYGALFFFGSKPAVVESCANVHRSATGWIIEKMMPKAYMFNEPVKAANDKNGIYRFVMTNKAEMERQKELAKTQGLKTLDIEAKEFFVDYQLLFSTFWFFLLAMILVTPISIKNKLIALVGSTVIFFGYSVLKIYVLILDFLTNQVSIGIYEFGEGTSAFLENLAATQKAGFSAIIVFLLWIGFALRKTNWKAFIGTLNKSIPKQKKIVRAKA